MTEWGAPGRVRKLTSGNGAVSVLAGSVAGYLDATGTAAKFGFLGSAVFDPTSESYLVADVSNNRIRRVTRAGVVTTVAGSASTAGTDGTGTSASFDAPRFMTVAPGPVFYIAEAGGCRVRRMSAAAEVTTIFAAPCGSSGLIYAAGIVWRPADQKLYIADSIDNTIKSLTLGGSLTTVAGLSGVSGSANGALLSARFYGPHGMALSPTGTLIVADRGNSVVREISLDGDSVSTLAGVVGATTSVDGSASSATFFAPMDISFAPHGGYMLIGEHESGKVRKLT